MDFVKKLLQRPLVGLDVGISGIKAVELTASQRGGRRLIAYNRVPLPWGTISPEGEIKEKELLTECLKALFSMRSFGSKRVAVAAFGNSIITKKISTAKVAPEELREQLYWEAEQYIPFNVNEVNLDIVVLGPDPGNPDQIEALLIAAKKDFLQTLCDVLRAAGLVPEVIDYQAFALGNAFEFNYKHLLGSATAPAPVSVLVDFGAGTTRVAVVEGDRTVFSRDLRQCGMGCTLLLSERLGISLEEAERAKMIEVEDRGVRGVVDEFNHALTEELARTIDFFMGQSPDKSIQGIYYCGGSSHLSGLVDELEARLTAPVQALNPVQNISGSGKKMNARAVRELSYLGTVAVGLALRISGDAA